MPGWRWRWRWRGRRCGRGRPCRWVFLSRLPPVKEFVPTPCLNPEPVELTYPEYEALLLVDLEGLSQEEASRRMGVSRGTVWRLLESARRKLATALVESRPISILSGGDVEKVRG